MSWGSPGAGQAKASTLESILAMGPAGRNEKASGLREESLFLEHKPVQTQTSDERKLEVAVGAYAKSGSLFQMDEHFVKNTMSFVGLNKKY